MPKYDNSDRLKTVGDKDWCEALDELTTYLRWRLRGKTQWVMRNRCGEPAGMWICY